LGKVKYRIGLGKDLRGKGVTGLGRECIVGERPSYGGLGRE
jgi:hypothetical protein